MLGCHASSEVFWREYPTNRDDYKTKYICRMCIAILGHSVKGDPFDEKYYGNYVEGKGYTKEAALKQMEANFKSIGDSLWD